MHKQACKLTDHVPDLSTLDTDEDGAWANCVDCSALLIADGPYEAKDWNNTTDPILSVTPPMPPITFKDITACVVDTRDGDDKTRPVIALTGTLAGAMRVAALLNFAHPNDGK